MMFDRFDCSGEAAVDFWDTAGEAGGIVPAANGEFCYAKDVIDEIKRLQDIIDKLTVPVVFNGKSAAEWCSLHAQSSLRLAKAEALLRRAYEARQKWHWEEGITFMSMTPVWRFTEVETWLNAS